MINWMALTLWESFFNLPEGHFSQLIFYHWNKDVMANMQEINIGSTYIGISTVVEFYDVKMRAECG